MTAKEINTIRLAIMNVKSKFPAYGSQDDHTQNILNESWNSLTKASVTLCGIVTRETENTKP